MARGRRRSAIKPTVSAPDIRAAADGSDGDAASDVERFVEARHQEFLAKATEQDSSDEDPGKAALASEAGVLDIDVSDSDDSEAGEPLEGAYGRDESVEEPDSDEESEADDADSEAWGGRRRMWYGGDTHEYEIMEDEEREEALKDEETEALRLQNKSLAELDADDFEDSDADKETLPGDSNPEDTAADDSAKLSMEDPLELKALIDDMSKTMSQLTKYKNVKRMSSSERVKFHIYSSLATNIAVYMMLRTDPQLVDVDIRSHSVIPAILKLRYLRDACEASDWTCFNEMYDRDIVSASDSPRKLRHEVQPPLEDAARKSKQHRSKSKPQMNGKTPGPDSNKEMRETSKPDVRAKSTMLANNSQLVANVFGPDGMAKILAIAEGDNKDDSRRKRNKLNRIVGELERNRNAENSKRQASADMESERKSPALPRHLRIPSGEDVDGMSEAYPGEVDEEQEEDDAELTARMLAKKVKKEAKAAKKQAANVPHVYRFDDRIKDKDMRRRANSQIVHNRGLTRYRPRDHKTPRAKNREAFSKAVKRRASAVRDPVAEKPTSYGGEASGINMRARKSARLSDV